MKSSKRKQQRSAFSWTFLEGVIFAKAWCVWLWAARSIHYPAADIGHYCCRAAPACPRPITKYRSADRLAVAHGRPHFPKRFADEDSAASFLWNFFSPFDMV
jgi:hypothetical protein